MSRKAVGPAKPKKGRRVVEELCRDDECPRQGQHWHPLSVDSFLAEEPGEYDVIVRVRVRESR
jgi:hypothetical protein